jgi:hypothetical protein
MILIRACEYGFPSSFLSIFVWVPAALLLARAYQVYQDRDVTHSYTLQRRRSGEFQFRRHAQVCD